jgi:hypothetical protein
MNTVAAAAAVDVGMMANATAVFAANPAETHTAHNQLCVGTGRGCFPSIQSALDVSSAGDVVRLGPGTFAGGVTIKTAVTFLGAGPASPRSAAAARWSRSVCSTRQCSHR